MFARSAFRSFQSAQALKQPLRRYATDAPAPPRPPPNSTSTFILMGTAAGLAGAGSYYFFVRSPAGQSVAKKAESAVQAAVPAKKALTGGEQGFIALQLDEVETVNHNTKRFRFRLPEDDMVSGLHIASAVLTKHQAEGAEKPTVRPYTPVSDEDARGYMDLLVKRYEGGPMSSHIHSMVPGQKLEVKGPLPKYAWEANKHEHIALVAGGTGITPMWQLCRAIFANPADKTRVTLVFGNLTEADILLRDRLDELENTYPQRFRAFHVLDTPPAEGWKGGKGYVSKELLKTVLPEPKEENIKVFVCGPPGMVKAISGGKKSPADQGELAGILKDLGYTKEQVYKF